MVFKIGDPSAPGDPYDEVPLIRDAIAEAGIDLTMTQCQDLLDIGGELVTLLNREIELHIDRAVLLGELCPLHGHHWSVFMKKI